MTDRPVAAEGVLVWDPFVRVFHWLLVALIATVWLLAGEWKAAHEFLGYCVAALVAARIVWGFVGPGHARFSDFVRGPRAVRGYLGDLLRGRNRRMLGHNPAGGAMIVALLLTIAATGLTGWLQTTDAWFGSPLLDVTHRTLGNGILALVAVHVGGVIFESLRHRENLVAAMLTGRKRPLAAEEAD
ncbi:cytochrome b/b6 domain-containing protein [Amaricoccus solimangrovi]|uniref:Cytochrome B n=1 Tax=Amaricoccus solimangrovi TaxID=2589815 RepID=A0A501WS98_9RHOB|nr:cytochrome b/b6 domain-containing protein [Amaricoccus solimangrovi]TPE50147.1 cytochrome B [Amaricoccus solimangrovi]